MNAGRVTVIAVLMLSALLVATTALPGVSAGKKRHHKKHKKHKHSTPCLYGCLYSGTTSQGFPIQITIKATTLGVKVGGITVSCPAGTTVTEGSFGFGGAWNGSDFSLSASSPLNTRTATGQLEGRTISGVITASDTGCTATNTYSATNS